mmetsp:Transcript_38783/g.52589  ORF Transcript_38783/g.52589 Transcript_38783/m.52589 type:complete len:120 (-) Transcript_38783:264-623(-)
MIESGKLEQKLHKNSLKSTDRLLAQLEEQELKSEQRIGKLEQAIDDELERRIRRLEQKIDSRLSERLREDQKYTGEKFRMLEQSGKSWNWTFRILLVLMGIACVGFYRFYVDLKKQHFL